MEILKTLHLPVALYRLIRDIKVMAHLAFSAHKGVYLTGVCMSLPSFLAPSLGDKSCLSLPFCPLAGSPHISALGQHHSKVQLLYIPLLGMITQGIAVFYVLPWNLSTLCLG